LLFIAFGPLLCIENSLKGSPSHFLTVTLPPFLAFFIWNISTTWWIYNASVGGALMAIFANSLLMSMVFWIFHFAKKQLLIANWQPAIANWLFPIFWLAFEFFHHRWELAWPWLTLGNAFAWQHKWIQWYEYTGTLGGSLWVLLVNTMVFSLLKNGSDCPDFSGWKMKNQKWKMLLVVLTIIFPIIISYSMYYSEKEKENPVNIVVVQPNIDPYSEKFSGLNFEEQLESMLDLAKQKTDSSTDYLVFPETALTENIWENNLEQTVSIKRLRDFLKSYPKLSIITGASTWYLYEDEKKLSVTARKFTNQDGFYDAFNTALQIDTSAHIQIYHKSKLVPGVERMPYPAVFGFLEKFAIDLGGTSGSLGTQQERTVFFEPRTQTGVAPVICYESIFGEFVGEYISNGATLIFIITNDGWWKDTPGYKQHLLYGRLRAIETRRSIARCANTGISCFINQRGDILQPTEWWKPAVIQAKINNNSAKTFYVQTGDVIGRVCFYVSAVVLLYVIVMCFIRKKEPQDNRTIEH
jgi:apolipoprotein N-acyltransferase